VTPRCQNCFFLSSRLSRRNTTYIVSPTVNRIAAAALLGNLTPSNLQAQSEPEGVNTVLLGFTLPKRRRHPSLELFHLSPQSALSAVAAAASPVSHTLTTALKIRRAVPHDFVIH
jgi:hypothetical protein